MLRDEDRMAAPRRLLSVVDRISGAEPGGDESARVIEHRHQSLLAQVLPFRRGEVKFPAERRRREAREHIV
jgi:hypothetical protein